MIDTHGGNRLRLSAVNASAARRLGEVGMEAVLFVRGGMSVVGYVPKVGTIRSPIAAASEADVEARQGPGPIINTRKRQLLGDLVGHD